MECWSLQLLETKGRHLFPSSSPSIVAFHSILEEACSIPIHFTILCAPHSSLTTEALCAFSCVPPSPGPPFLHHSYEDFFNPSPPLMCSALFFLHIMFPLHIPNCFSIFTSSPVYHHDSCFSPQHWFYLPPQGPQIYCHHLSLVCFLFTYHSSHPYSQLQSCLKDLRNYWGSQNSGINEVQWSTVTTQS